jgi:hypothetical protein
VLKKIGKSKNGTFDLALGSVSPVTAIDFTATYGTTPISVRSCSGSDMRAPTPLVPSPRNVGGGASRHSVRYTQGPVHGPVFGAMFGAPYGGTPSRIRLDTVLQPTGNYAMDYAAHHHTDERPPPSGVPDDTVPRVDPRGAADRRAGPSVAACANCDVGRSQSRQSHHCDPIRSASHISHVHITVSCPPAPQPGHGGVFSFRPFTSS